MRMVRPGALSARQTARFVATVVTPRPPLVEKTDVSRQGRAAGWVGRRIRRSFSRAAARSSAWTGRRRNSTAPPRMTSMTKSAETLGPVAKTAASGKARARASTILAGGPSAPPARSSGRSTMTRSGRLEGPSWIACESRLNSPTTSVAELLASKPFSGEPESATMMVRNVGVMRWLICRHAALAEGPRHDLTYARDTWYQGEVLLLLGPEVHEASRVGSGAGRVGLDQLDGHEEQELGLVVLEPGAAEQRAQDRDVAEQRDLRHGLANFIVDEAGDGERLPVLQVDGGRDLVLPVIRKNEVATTVNLKDGESFAIAGLINNEVRQAVAKIPVLGDIPILGALFRSTRFQNNETELLFLVTVKLVKADPPGSGPDPRRLMDLRPEEKKDFTLVPGIPGVGEIMPRPFGQSSMPAN